MLIINSHFRGFEKDIVTAVIILSRFPGALAHWRESLGKYLPYPPQHPALCREISSPNSTAVQPVKLWRPQQIYKENASN